MLGIPDDTLFAVFDILHLSVKSTRVPVCVMVAMDTSLHWKIHAYGIAPPELKLYKRLINNLTLTIQLDMLYTQSSVELRKIQART